MHGAKFKDDDGQAASDYQHGMLPSPDEVEHLSDEEKKALTKDLMAKFAGMLGGNTGIKMEG